MKKIILILIFVVILWTTSNIWLKFLNNAFEKINPESKLYFLKAWWEKIVIFFTFNAENRAEKYRAFAEKRASDAKEMVSKGKTELAQKINEIYKSYLNKAKDALEKAIQKAIEKEKEELKRTLEEKVDDIMNEIKNSINL